MPRPKIRLTCCLCSKAIAQKGNVYPLDAEWLRRHPAMGGTLACRCALENTYYWLCEKPGGGSDEGHIPVADEDGPVCLDSWSHIGIQHTLVAAVTTYPRSALLQGAEEYLRYTSSRPGVNAEVARHLKAALAEWDAQPRKPSDAVSTA